MIVGMGVSVGGKVYDGSSVAVGLGLAEGLGVRAVGVALAVEDGVALAEAKKPLAESLRLHARRVRQNRHKIIDICRAGGASNPDMIAYIILRSLTFLLHFEAGVIGSSAAELQVDK